MASSHAQGLLLAILVGCWLVCNVASRTIRVSVSPGTARSHRAPESVSSSAPIDQVVFQPARKLDHLSRVQVEARKPGVEASTWDQLSGLERQKEPMTDLASSPQELVAGITQKSNHLTSVASQSQEVVCQQTHQIQQMIVQLSQRRGVERFGHRRQHRRLGMLASKTGPSSSSWDDCNPAPGRACRSLRTTRK